MGVSYPGGKSPDKAARAFAAMMRRSENLTPAMKVGAEAIVRLIANTFQNSTSPTGVPWKELSKKTIKKRKKNSDKPLLDSTRLSRSLLNASHGARSIRFGTNVEYAGFHQFGTRHIRARPFMPITAQGELTMAGPAKTVFDRISRQVGNYIVNGKLVG